MVKLAAIVYQILDTRGRGTATSTVVWYEAQINHKLFGKMLFINKRELNLFILWPN